YRHAPVLERAGRVVALHLEPDLGSGQVREPPAVHQRRPALAQGHGRRVRRQVEAVAVLLDDPAPLVRAVPRPGGPGPRAHWSPSTRITEETSRTKSMPRSACTV